MNRTEKDALGEKEVDSEAYYGIFTQRAIENFQISGIKATHSFLKTLAIIKKAAANSNIKLGVLDEKTGNAIVAASDEIIAGNYLDQFPLDVFQAGAGTPFNMNMNEVIANIAIEKLGGKKGQYNIVHPNNHVNMAQSSNDVIPTAIRLAVLFDAELLQKELKLLAKEIDAKAADHRNILKVGRTHLQDAVPMTYDQMFSSYSTAIAKCTRRINDAKKELQQLGIGGTAIGTGINTDPLFKKHIIEELKKETSMELSVADDTIETTWSGSDFLQFSGSLKVLAVEMAKIADDLMLLNSGPKAGISEIKLPEAEPGSSIMPGKVNPSITECLKMVCFQVIGNDLSVMESARSGVLELNVYTPLIMHDLLWSIKLMTNGTRMFRELCIKDLKVNTERTGQHLEESLVLATALNPYLGYEVVAEIVKISLEEKKTLRQVIGEKKLIEPEDLDKVLNAAGMTKPSKINLELQKKIKEKKEYLQFKASLGK